MKFCDKYPQLKEKGFLAKLLTDTVFSTMQLENQKVPKLKVQEIVLSLLGEKKFIKEIPKYKIALPERFKLIK